MAEPVGRRLCRSRPTGWPVRAGPDSPGARRWSRGAAVIQAEARLESGDAAGVPDPLRTEIEGYKRDDCLSTLRPGSPTRR